MNNTELYSMDPVRERFRNKLQRLIVTDDMEEIAALARGLTNIVDGIRPRNKPRMPVKKLVSFN